MGERFSFIATVFMILLFIPFVVIALFSDKRMLRIENQLSLDEYLAGIVYQEIPENYPKEAVKAQVVLARSTWMKKMENGLNLEEYWSDMADTIRSQMKETGFRKTYEEICRAISETESQVLMYGEEICYGAFHKVSAGYTRNGKDVFEKTTYEYLTGVESVMDQESESYLTGHYFTPDFLEKEFRNHGLDISLKNEEDMVVKKRDYGGYVQSIKIGDSICTGEEIRQILHLSSAAFSIEMYDEKIRFLCRGQGHGMGLSQYGASRMAKEGYTYREILNYYFPQAQIIEKESE